MKINETYMTPRMGAVSRTEQRTRGAAAPEARKTGASRFDTVMISTARKAAQDPAITHLRESISMDVRAASASAADQVAALREQVRSGIYRVDTTAIARKMLAMGGLAG